MAQFSLSYNLKNKQKILGNIEKNRYRTKTRKTLCLKPTIVVTNKKKTKKERFSHSFLKHSYAGIKYSYNSPMPLLFRNCHFLCRHDEFLYRNAKFLLNSYIGMPKPSVSSPNHCLKGLQNAFFWLWVLCCRCPHQMPVKNYPILSWLITMEAKPGLSVSSGVNPSLTQSLAFASGANCA